MDKHRSALLALILHCGREFLLRFVIDPYEPVFAFRIPLWEGHKWVPTLLTVITVGHWSLILQGTLPFSSTPPSMFSTFPSRRCRVNVSRDRWLLCAQHKRSSTDCHVCLCHGLRPRTFNTHHDQTSLWRLSHVYKGT